MHLAANFLKKQFPAEIVEVIEYRGDTTVVVKPGRIREICQALRDDADLSLKYLSMIAAVDYAPQSPRFALAYNLYSHKNHDRVMLKTFLRERHRPGHRFGVPGVVHRRLARTGGLRPHGHQVQGPPQSAADSAPQGLEGPSPAQGLPPAGRSARRRLGRSHHRHKKIKPEVGQTHLRLIA